MKIETIPLTQIRPYAQNAKAHPQDQIDRIARSIQEFGFKNPILIDADNTLIAGHGRLLAAQQLGLKTIPAIRAADLTPDQIRAYRIADNKLAESSWLDDILSAELQALTAADFDISLLGLSPDEITALQPEKEGLTDPDALPDIPEDAEPITQLGELWLLGQHRLLCGDCRKREDVDRLMNGKKADMVFTDPPYGINIVKKGSVEGGGDPLNGGYPFGGAKAFGTIGGAKAFGTIGGAKAFGTIRGANIVKAKTYLVIANDQNDKVAHVFYDYAIEKGIPEILLWGGNFYSFLPISSGWVVWDKQMTGTFGSCELAWTNQNRPIKKYEWLWNGLSRRGNRKDELIKRIHPTQKPVGLFCEILADYEGKFIIDPFLGSGTTLIACEKTGRTCYGMEIEPHYCDIIIKRWEDFTGKKAQLEHTRKS